MADPTKFEMSSAEGSRTGSLSADQEIQHKGTVHPTRRPGVNDILERDAVLAWLVLHRSTSR